MRHGAEFSETFRIFVEKAGRSEIAGFISAFREKGIDTMFEYNDAQLVLPAADMAKKDPVFNVSMLDSWLGTLSRLANQMHLAGMGGLSGESGIPAGYTYVAQLAIHDMVDSISPKYELGGSLPSSKTMESIGFDLGTIYGAGPARNPSLFEPSDGDKFRSRFRLGYMNSVVGQTGFAPGPRSDIARLRIGPECGGIPGDTRFDPLLADARNADNLILSQITVLFLKLHNIECAKAKASGNTAPFETAKAEVQAAWAAIIAEDLAPKLLDRTIWAERRAANASATTTAAIASEAVFAGLRFGHTMVRRNYEINDLRDGMDTSTIARLLEFFGLDGGGPFPPDVSWLIDWRRFFDLRGVSPDPSYPTMNMARRIAPTMAEDLQNAKSVRLPDDMQTPQIENGLAYRTLARGIVHLLPSGQGMIDAMKQNGIAVDWELEASEIRAALATTFRPIDSLCRPETCLTSADVLRLEEKTPLFLYILIEAADDRSSGKLGPLGSFIVGDAFAKALAPANAPGSKSKTPVAASMPALVAYVARNEHLV